MDDASLLVVAMAQQCRKLIQEWNEPVRGLPKALWPKHLLWMCNEIECTVGLDFFNARCWQTECSTSTGQKRCSIR